VWSQLGGDTRLCFIIPRHLPCAAAINLRFGDLHRYIIIVQNLLQLELDQQVAFVLGARGAPIHAMRLGATGGARATAREGDAIRTPVTETLE
jgi:hypothetical protein